jgi:hypothetical protein
VCIASIARTAPARPANAFSSSPHRGDLVALGVHGDLPEDRADAVGQGRGRVRGLPVLVLRSPDGLAVDGDHQPAAGPHSPRPQPGTENLVQHVSADQGERPPEGGLVRRAARRAECGRHVRPGIVGPLPDRGERPRSRDHRRDPGGQQPGRRMPPPAPFPRVRDLGQEIEQVLAAVSRHRRRCHRRAESSWQAMVSIENFHRSARGPSAARGHAGRITRRYDIAGQALNSRLCREDYSGLLVEL